MDKTFNNSYGTFTLNADANTKITSIFERGGNYPGEMAALLRPYITADSTVLDIGAHIGTMSIAFSKMAKKYTLLNLCPKIFSILRKTLCKTKLLI